MTSSHKMYAAVLNSPGTCDRDTMCDVLSDTFSFSHAEAAYLLNHLPVRIVSHMSETEADSIVEMFEAYGASASFFYDDRAEADQPDDTAAHIEEGAAFVGALLLADALLYPCPCHVPHHSPHLR